MKYKPTGFDGIIWVYPYYNRQDRGKCDWTSDYDSFSNC